MTTTETTQEQVEERLERIAPHPDSKTVTAAGLARYLAVLAQMGFARNVTPFIRDDQEVPAGQILAEFAAAHALIALAEANPEYADETARRIIDAWEDPGCLGGYLHHDVTSFGVDPDELARLDGIRLALENAERGEKPDELARLRNAARTMGSVIVSMSRQMECARIEMLQNGPEKAMQWILNGLPDVDDNPAEMQWDGKESADKWFERTADYARAEAAS